MRITVNTGTITAVRKRKLRHSSDLRTSSLIRTLPVLPIGASENQAISIKVFLIDDL
jgi:hypothetical protein